jgi:PIN domain nuclease of toxin-antitoxin system
VWEIIIKWTSGKLALPCPPDEFIKKARIESMLESVPVFESSALQVAKLPKLHKDPFDRILIAQSIEHGLALATPDPLIRQYAVKTIWD